MPLVEEYLLKEPQFNVLSSNSSRDDLHQPFESQNQGQPLPPHVLPPKPLRPLRKFGTLRNVLITFAAVCVYGGCTFGSIYPGLNAGFPFYPLLQYYGNHGLAGNFFPCEPSLYSGQFAINLAWGSLTYTSAKILDAGINLVLGRGAQVVLTWLSYHLFSMAILRIIQENCVPLELYTAMAFDTTSVKGAWYQLRAVTKVDTVRAKVTLIWLAISVSYLIALPTLLDLTTGYIVEYQTMVNITTPGDSTHKLIELNSTQLNAIREGVLCATGSCGPRSSWYYTPQSGLYTSIVISGANISFNAFYDDKYNWIMQSEKKPDGILQCVPSSTYQWGLSSGYLWIVCFVTSLWVAGMFAVWIDSFRNGVLWRSGRGFGRYRNIIDIAEHLHSNFGYDLCAYTHEELEKKVDRLEPVGVEVLADGEWAHIRLGRNPGGKHLLSTPGLQYGDIGRLRSRHVSATWPLPSGGV
ncbi:uncharacterized protein Z520_10541 [Fonsecaea multimorphosa CBS 102226]|uniref:Uncharacterized protein n=1 Tax=Fonsecaea multimorphosa CBS 102226 TaxID=1442371 RepID=A0A0D2GVJ7_9EURO|nr:uncharacterized protein Z520_10541 [Fonsecaea multimorphosa CBS 102226]KIX93635.1 hypothetical protein Z520_10541 [Fonsecaea multimorphosa CBS 102226]OAL19750.1 hypothetical protein AYO22_09277 [Fonsecaea multimorphosa]